MGEYSAAAPCIVTITVFKDVVESRSRCEV
jgi:hypothetical protein